MDMTQYINTVSYQDLADFFYSRHPQLQKYLFWQVRSHDIAEELAQETYVRFLRQSEPQQIFDLNAFLFTIAANLARDHLRSVKREQSREFVSLDNEIADSKPHTEDIIAKQCLEAQLHQAIDSLPEKTREIFLLYRADELSYKQIAVQLDISERTVEYHLRQAMLHCRRCLINRECV
jgi:RNA polymerase sigma factor (sigma-70 family)